jgi:ABC-type Fe3+/spermidine/putrescine transport system ATPase subunit
MTEWEVDGLTSRVDGFGLGPIDLRLPAGEAVAVVGRSGVGKTTLLRAIAGLLPPLAGRVLRDGVEMTRRPPEERHLGYIPQSLALFPHRSVAGNVAYPLERRHDAPDPSELRRLLERFGLRELASRRASQLSGGERQRVAIARALAATPSLLLWDEPLSALDATARSELADLLGGVQRSERIPLLVVTHDPEVAFSLADRLLLLDDGRPAFLGPTTALLEGMLTPFLARFIGYENVFARAVLERSEASPIREWLLQRSGPEGVALAAGSLRLVDASSPGFDGRLRHIAPRPDAVDLRVEAQGWVLVVRHPLAAGGKVGPRLGDPVRVQIDATRARPLAAEVGYG